VARVTAIGVWETADVGCGVDIPVADDVEFGQNMYPSIARLMIVPLQNNHHNPGFNHILGADGETTHGADRSFNP
jgi:hypothetical protein